MIVIADTTPLNYLILIEEVEVLPNLFGIVVIPPAVASELQRASPPDAVRNWIMAPPDWLRVQAPKATTAPELDYLGAGERDAILLAQEIHPNWLIMDDYNGRREAGRRHLPVIGTVRVLDEAASRHLVDLPKALGRLEQTTFYLSPDLKDWLLERHAARKRNEPGRGK